jgi:hypothetical protein
MDDLDKAKADMLHIMNDNHMTEKKRQQQRRRAQKAFYKLCKRVTRELKRYPNGPQVLATMQQRGAFDEPHDVRTATQLMTIKQLEAAQTIPLLLMELATARADLFTATELVTAQADVITATCHVTDSLMKVHTKYEDDRKQAEKKFKATRQRVQRLLKKSSNGTKQWQALKDRGLIQAPPSRKRKLYQAPLSDESKLALKGTACFCIPPSTNTKHSYKQR